MSVGAVGSSPITIAPPAESGAASAPIQGVEGATDQAAAVIGQLLAGIGENLDIVA